MDVSLAVIFGEGKTLSYAEEVVCDAMVKTRTGCMGTI
jgi:hypothetical protein